LVKLETKVTKTKHIVSILVHLEVHKSKPCTTYAKVQQLQCLQ